MYVISIKLNKIKLIAVAMIICIFAAIACIILPDASSDVLNSNVSSSVKSIDDHIAFLNAFGYNVDANPVQIQEIIIPDEFSEEYKKYNEIQKMSGFDLSKYKGYRAKKYTYKITNYSGTEEVVANLIVYNNKVIGGDVSSTSLGGFIHGFIKE